MGPLLPMVGDAVFLEVDVDPDAGSARVTSTCCEATGDTLTVHAPPADALPDGVDLTDAHVLAGWVDPSGALCRLPTTLVTLGARDCCRPWTLRAAGAVSRLPRHRHRHEQVCGSARVTVGGGASGRVDGQVVDLSENGMRIRFDTCDGLRVSTTAHVSADLDDEESPLSLTGTVVRLHALRYGWEVALAFPAAHRETDRVRDIVSRTRQVLQRRLHT